MVSDQNRSGGTQIDCPMVQPHLFFHFSKFYYCLQVVFIVNEICVCVCCMSHILQIFCKYIKILKNKTLFGPYL